MWIGDLPSLGLAYSMNEKLLWDMLKNVCLTPGARNYVVCQGIALSDTELLRSRVFASQVNDGLVAHDMQAGGVILSAQTTLPFTPHTQEVQTMNPVEVAGVLDGTGGLVDTGGFR